MDFKGRLKVAGDTGPGIPVDLRLDDIYLELWTEGEELGVWRLDVVEVARSAGNKFSLDLDGEAMVFEAIDPLGFAYEGLTFLEAVSSKLRKKRRGFRRRAGESQPLRGARVPGRSEPEPAAPVNEERVRSLPGVAALEQVDALPEPAPERPAAAASGGLGAFFASPADAPANHPSAPTTQDPPLPSVGVPIEPPSPQPAAEQPVVRERPAQPEEPHPQPDQAQPDHAQPDQAQPDQAGPDRPQLEPVAEVAAPSTPEPEVVVVEELASVSYAHDAVVEVPAPIEAEIPSSLPQGVTEPDQVSQSGPDLPRRDPEQVADPEPVAEVVEETEAVVEPEPVVEVPPMVTEPVTPESVVEPEPVAEVVEQPEAVVEPEPVVEEPPMVTEPVIPETVVEPEPVAEVFVEESEPVLETEESRSVEPVAEAVASGAVVEEAVVSRPVVEPETGEVSEPVLPEPEPVIQPAAEVGEAGAPAAALNGRAPIGELHEAVIADPHADEADSVDADDEDGHDDGAADVASEATPAPRGRHTTSRRGRRSKRKRTDDHDHEYDIARTVGGLTRRVCMHCGHVSFDSEDVYQGWG